MNNIRDEKMNSQSGPWPFHGLLKGSVKKLSASRSHESNYLLVKLVSFLSITSCPVPEVCQQFLSVECLKYDPHLCYLINLVNYRIGLQNLTIAKLTQFLDNSAHILNEAIHAISGASIRSI